MFATIRGQEDHRSTSSRRVLATHRADTGEHNGYMSVVSSLENRKSKKDCGQQPQAQRRRKLAQPMPGRRWSGVKAVGRLGCNSRSRSLQRMVRRLVHRTSTSRMSPLRSTIATIVLPLEHRALIRHPVTSESLYSDMFSVSQFLHPTDLAASPLMRSKS